MNTYCIYCYTNKINGKKYIGQTCKSLKGRAGREGSNYVVRNGFFGRAIIKYGWCNFVPEILEDGLSLEEANDREEYWIRELDTLVPNGYNLEKGGMNHECHELTRQKFLGENNPFYGKHHKKEVLEIIERKRAEYWEDKENREAQSQRLKGNKNASGHVLSDESKETIYRKTQEYWANEENRKHQSERSKAFWEDETYRKTISEKNRLRTQDPHYREEHSRKLKGRHLYNNGEVTIMAFESPGPEWVLGRLQKKKDTEVA